MAVENIQEVLERLELAVQTIMDSAIELKMDVERVASEASLADQIKQVEAIIEDSNEFSQVLNQEYTNILDIINNEINAPYHAELDELIYRHLEEEIDTPREAVELLKDYLANPNDPRKLEVVLGFIKSTLPPTVEEIEIIPFETARIEDSELAVGEEIVEVEGVNGEVKVVYEVVMVDGAEERVEVEREVLVEMVRSVVRVGTKEPEIEEPTE